MPTPERTSHAEIVAAAQALIEDGGPAAVTMAAVAQRVGVRAPSLYKRVRDRDALLTDVAQAAAEALAVRLAAAGASIEDLARAYRAFARERPEAFRLIFTAAAPEDALRRAAEPVFRVVAAEVGDEDALDAARLVTAWATGFVQMELAGAFRLGGDVDRAFDFALAHLVAGLRARRDADGAASEAIPGARRAPASRTGQVG